MLPAHTLPVHADGFLVGVCTTHHLTAPLASAHKVDQQSWELTAPGVALRQWQTGWRMDAPASCPWGGTTRGPVLYCVSCPRRAALQFPTAVTSLTQTLLAAPPSNFSSPLLVLPGITSKSETKQNRNYCRSDPRLGIYWGELYLTDEYY